MEGYLIFNSNYINGIVYSCNDQHMRRWAICGWWLQLHGHGSSQVTWYPEYPSEPVPSIEVYNGGFGFSVIRSSDRLVCIGPCGCHHSSVGTVGPVVGVAIGFDTIYYVHASDGDQCEVYRSVVGSLKECLCGPQMMPLCVGTLPRIKSIAAGESQCVMASHDGRVFQYVPKDCGDGRMMEEVDVGCFVVHVCCGSHHSVALTRDGHVWTWGDSLRGQCGRGIRESDPGMVDFGPVKMRYIAAGSSFTLSCSAGGDVYSWGSNADGALGLSENVTSTYQPMLIDYFGVEDRDVVRLAAGSSHALALTTKGVVYGFGSNRFGQLGVGQQIKETHTPIQIGLQKTCYDVAAGWWHSVFVTDV